MKKLIVMFISIISFSAVFAQQDNNRDRIKDRYESGNINGIYNRNSRDYSKDRNFNGNDRDWNDRDRREEIERMNRDYDQRIKGYRNNRSMNSYERNQRIQQAERERQQKANSFGKGLALGGIAGVIIGVLIGR